MPGAETPKPGMDQREVLVMENRTPADSSTQNVPKESQEDDAHTPDGVTSSHLAASRDALTTTSSPGHTDEPSSLHNSANPGHVEAALASADETANDTTQEDHGNFDHKPSRESTLNSVGAAWTPGTHVLLNARSGTALDLSGADQRTLIGFPAHMGQNQQWEFIPSGRGYTIRSACPSSCGLYLSVESLCDNAPIVASPFPVSWNVRFDEKEDGAMRIYWPNTDFVIDLADWGSPTPGTKVQLMREKPGESCQLWRYTRCAPAEDQEEKVAQSASRPMISETVIVSEGKDHITTTRTTTTTTVATITTVTRTARGVGVY